MNDMQYKLKQWVELIQSGMLSSVTEDIKESFTFNPDEKQNRGIFKLLLYLSHTTDKCYNEKGVLGREIYNLTHLLCSIMTEIPDVDKFLSCMFHITRYLISIHLYNDAANICLRIISEKVKPSEMNTNGKLLKISYLWRNAAINLLNQTQSQPLESKDYEELKIIVTAELNLLQAVSNSQIKECIACLDQYLCKLSTFSKESLTLVNDFYVFVLKSLEKYKNASILCEDKNRVYRHAKSICSKIIRSSINENLIKNQKSHKVHIMLNDIYESLEPILAKDKECYCCFKLIKDLCIILLNPVETFTQDNADNMRNYVQHYLKTAAKYEYSDIFITTTLGIIEILDPLFVYWESCLKCNKKELLSDGIFLETMKLVECVSAVCAKQTFTKCKSCNKEECNVKTDIYNNIVIKVRTTTLVTKLSSEDLPKDVCKLTLKFSRQIISAIYEMKVNNCKCWTQLWSCCGIIIYNMGITSERFYKESSAFYSLLCSSIIRLEGLHSNTSHLDLEHPLSLALHRLCSTHYKNEQYREAMTAAALNGFISYNNENSKAFRMWTNIKYKNSNSKEILGMSMLACLRTDGQKIRKEFDVDITSCKSDFIELCLREVQSLEEGRIDLYCAISAVLDELDALKANSLQRARALVFLGHHLLSFEHDYRLSERIQQSLAELREENNNSSVSCIRANLKFLMFVEQLRAISKRTAADMKIANPKTNLFALKLPITVKQVEDEEDVIPTYSMITMNDDSSLASTLQKAFKEWIKYLNIYKKTDVVSWEVPLTIRTLIIAGEYARLYRYQDCEINAWTLAYKLALPIKDYRTIIYVTSRSIAIRRINKEWIDTAKEYANLNRNTNDSDIINTIALFWISLSDFYFECGKHIEARKLLNEARNLPGICFLENSAVYLLSLDTIIRNWQLYYEQNVGHEQYTTCIVESLYSLINLGEQLKDYKTTTWRNQAKFLFTHDVVFSFVVNMSLRMNSLLSFREISAHLISRLKAAQEMGVTMRAAEILKSLCYIDLSRLKLDDCEVKLQWLEHILHTESFDLSLTKERTPVKQPVSTLSPVKVIDPMRDVPQADTSPILRKKTFKLPDFVKHLNCNCYDCRHASYRYLVFASTHVRAQLYALQNYVTPALQHFHGAFEVRRHIMKSEELEIMNDDQNNSTQQSTWQGRFFLQDYVLFLLDFSGFLRRSVPSKTQEELHVASLAVDVCEANQLESHPLYMAAKALVFDIQFRKVFDESISRAYTVPHIHKLDLQKEQESLQSSSDEIVCVTPVGPKNYNIKARSIRRVRTPPLLQITKISMNYDDEEEEEDLTPLKISSRKKMPITKAVRRKILSEELSDAEESEANTECFPKTNKSESEIMVNNIKDAIIENCSVSDVIVEVASLVPDISDQLYKLAGDLHNVPATPDRMETLIGMVEDLKLISNSHIKRKPKSSEVQKVKRLPRREHNKKVNEAVELFKRLIIKKSLTKVEEKGNDSKVSGNAVTDATQSTTINVTQHKISVEQNSCTEVNNTNLINRNTLAPLRGNVRNSSEHSEAMNNNEKIITRSTRNTGNSDESVNSKIEKSSRLMKALSLNASENIDVASMKDPHNVTEQENTDLPLKCTLKKLRNQNTGNPCSSENENVTTKTCRTSTNVNKEAADTTKPTLRRSRRKL